MYVKERFQLDPYICDNLHDLEPPFGYNGFGEFIFYRTYSRNIEGRQETWADCVIRVINGIMSIRKNHYVNNHISWDTHYWRKFSRELAMSMFKMEWLPPGRGLWACGTDFIYERGAMALYNCFSGDTEFFDGNKLVKFEDVEGQEVNVITADGKRANARVKSFGKQKLYRVSFKPTIGHSNLRLEYLVTKNHNWILANGDTVTDLKPKDKVKILAQCVESIDQNSQEYINGYSHGIIFGDGTRQTVYHERFSIRLCDDPDHIILNKLSKSSWYQTSCQPPSYKGDFVATLINREINLKELPLEENIDYLKGFFEGWLEVDSHKSKRDNRGKRYCLDTSNTKAAEWAIKYARLFGYIPTGHSLDNKDTNFDPRTYPLNRIIFSKTDTLFSVESITDEGIEEEVYCVVEPITHSFTLAGGISTGNCGATDIYFDDFADDYAWIMDSLMLGVGVGFSPKREEGFQFKKPKGSFEHIIGDSREGWIDSVIEIINCYMFGSSKPQFIYDEIRPKGLPIKGFGGISSGPEPLKEFHIQLEEDIDRFMTDKHYDSVMLKTDIANKIGCMVVSGNVRRSAELAQLSIEDPVFKDLKNYDKYPQREAFGWMSNNSVDLERRSDFNRLGDISKRVIERGEPGYKNLKNFKYGRIGKKDKVKKDRGRLVNPCAEIILEGGYDNLGRRVREVCNVDETCPTVCENPKSWYKSCEYATYYSSTVALLPTHQPSTNRVVSRNRRIGVGIIDFTGWVHNEGLTSVTKYLRKGYKIVRKTNRLLASEAGVPESIRVTTMKPGGTIPKLPGKTSGSMYPNFQFMIRRVRVQRNHPIHAILVNAGIPYEADYVSKNTDVFEWPLECGPALPAEEISLWHQAMNLVLLQREWADNAVSNTLNFRPKWQLIKSFSIFNDCNEPFESSKRWLNKNINMLGADYDLFINSLCTCQPETVNTNFKLLIKHDTDFDATEVNFYEYDPRHEEDSIEPVLAAIAPLTKTVSLLPHSTKGAYKQQPEEGITKEEYDKRLSRIRKIDWSKLSDSDGMDEKYCDSVACEISN